MMLWWQFHEENNTTNDQKNKLMHFRYSTENISLRINSLILGATGLVSFWHRSCMYTRHTGLPCSASAHTGYANMCRKIGRCSHMSRRVRRMHPTCWPEGPLCWGSSAVEDENSLAFWHEADSTICHSVQLHGGSGWPKKGGEGKGEADVYIKDQLKKGKNDVNS